MLLVARVARNGCIDTRDAYWHDTGVRERKADGYLDGDYLTPPEAARWIPGADASSVRRWAEEGLLEGAIRLPSGRWQVPWSAVIGILGFDPREGEGPAAGGDVGSIGGGRG